MAAHHHPKVIPRRTAWAPESKNLDHAAHASSRGRQYTPAQDPPAEPAQDAGPHPEAAEGPQRRAFYFFFFSDLAAGRPGACRPGTGAGSMERHTRRSDHRRLGSAVRELECSGGTSPHTPPHSSSAADSAPANQPDSG